MFFPGDMTKANEQFMRRALELARRGLGAVEPNPMVGAVIVRDGAVLGEGWHQRFGGPHAEVEALAAAKAGGSDVRGATMYVTLEPCNHHGKTPPCTEAIIASGIARVVAAMEDPDELVAGRGLAKLRAAGIEVETGLCQAEARELLAAYVKLRTLKRPWVICKWAQTSDGRLALPAGLGPHRGAGPSGGSQRWISCEKSRAMVHELRGYCDGICVGSGTVLADDPLLTNRSGRGRQPTRVILDAQLRTPPGSRLIETASAKAPVLLATTARALEVQAASAGMLAREGVEFLALPGEASGGVSLGALLDELGRRKWTRLLVEGGPTVLRRVISEHLADELWVFISPHAANAQPGRAAMADGANAPGAEPGPSPAEQLPRLDIRDIQAAEHLRRPRQIKVGHDTLLKFRLA
jgi:diaminohydroxyphosphoribosylaminopyrimidine deaminase/5-amino-6-(5-phosphoribosylamino)uracil reductase